MKKKTPDNEIDIETSDTYNSDIVAVDDNGDESLMASVGKLKHKLKVCSAEKKEYLDGWQRCRSDFTNFKKDQSESLVRAREKQTISVVEQLLPVLDSFDHAFSNEEAWNNIDENWRKGVEYIHSQFQQVLDGLGVTKIDPKEGDAYNHEVHETIESHETNDSEKDQMIEKVVQSGYRCKEYIIRPARVITLHVK